MPLLQQTFSICIFTYSILFFFSMYDFHHRIKFPIFFYHILLYDLKPMFIQKSSDFSNLRLWLQDHCIQRICYRSSFHQDFYHQTAAHAGSNHRIHFSRKDFFQSVRKSGFYLFFQSMADYMHSGSLQGTSVDIQCDHFLRYMMFYQVNRNIAVICTDICNRSALCHQICNCLQSL